MKLSTVIVGMLLAFLLFTPQGQTLGGVLVEMALYAAKPAPDPAKLATETAKREACVKIWKDWDAKVTAEGKALGMPSYKYFVPASERPSC